MGLPIAVGGRALSSRPVPSASPLPEDANDGTPLEPIVLPCAPRVATTVSQDHRFAATCCIFYYDMKRQDNGRCDSTLAEITVQISPLAQGYSGAYRDMLYRIPLSKCESEHDFIPLTPSAVFSSDGRHLACLIPHPRAQRSILVIFQLRKPRSHPPAAPPRPFYLGPVPETPVVPVATNPHLVQLPNGLPLLQASAICNAYSEGSVLLAGCVDGGILVIAYRLAQVAGILHHSDQEDAIVYLSHRTDSHDPVDGSRGKLVALEQGSGAAVIFTSHMLVSDTSNLLLMQLQRHLTLEGPFMPSAVWIESCFLALIVKPILGESAAVQVWPITDRQTAAKPVSTMFMTPERLKEYAHGSFPLEEESEEADEQHFSCNNAMGTCLHYDESSGCLAASSFVVVSADDEDEDCFTVLPYVCVWHWRTNVTGLTLTARSRRTIMDQHECVLWQRPIQSALFFSKNNDGKLTLTHVIHDSSNDWKSRSRIQKQVYTLALLSPSETLTPSGCEQPASLMVSSNCVSFPHLSRTFAGEESELSWKDSRIPSSYISLFGAPQLASIGRKRCRTIAVAASRGVCVLDCSKMQPSSRCEFDKQWSSQNGFKVSSSTNEGFSLPRIEQPKWRLFGNEAEEKSFRVLAMTWWEGEGDGSSDDIRSDDLLVAVIEVHEDEKGQESEHPRYLACWSRRSLNKSHQMIVSMKSDTKNKSEWGIPLPAGFYPTSISLLPEPVPMFSFRETNDLVSETRKAVVLLTSHGKAANASVDDDSFELFQLRVIRGKGDPGMQEAKFNVEASLRSNGTFPDSTRTPKSVISGVFLASASFDFPKERAASSSTFLATVGLIRSPGYGLEAVTISSSGTNKTRDIIDGLQNGNESQPSNEVSNFWHSYISCGSSHEEHRPFDGFFAWSVELCSGTLLCWLVPYLPGQLDVVRSIDVTEHTSNITNGFGPQTSHEDFESSDTSSFFGCVTTVGDTSCWMQESSAANRTAFSLGSIPNVLFGCILRCSQSGKQLHRVVSEDSDTNLDHEVFCLGSTELAPPSFIPSLFASLLGELESGVTESTGNCSSLSIHFSAAARMSLASLKDTANSDTAMVALRLLVIRTVELIAKESSRMGNDYSRRQSLFLLTSAFEDITDAARHCLSPMQFASLFLGIGRQIEPSYLPHLFPLPLSRMVHHDGALPHMGQSCDVRSVEDLFLNSIRNGSVTVPSSALPLFSSKIFSLRMCGSLLHHCLVTFGVNTGTPASAAFDRSTEERRLLRSIFRFGIKIEDSASMPHNTRGPGILNGLNGVHSEYYYSDSDGDEMEPVAQIIVRKKNSSRICQLFSPSALFASLRAAKEEDEIVEAASSFILSGFDENKYNSVELAQNGHSSHDWDSSSLVDDSHEKSMAGIVASFILPMVFTSDVTEDPFRWKRTSKLAQVLLGDSYVNMDAFATAKIRECKPLIEGVTLEEISLSLKIIMSELDKRWLVRWFGVQLVDCSSKMSPAQSMPILHLALALLSRHKTGEDIKECVPGLLLLAFVAGHCADYSDELLETNPKSVITSAYSTALNDLHQ